MNMSHYHDLDKAVPRYTTCPAIFPHFMSIVEPWLAGVNQKWPGIEEIQNLKQHHKMGRRRYRMVEIYNMYNPYDFQFPLTLALK